MSTSQKIVWEDSYNIGIDAIDTQHKSLFDLVNRLYDLGESKDIKEEMRSILYEFREYMIVHFRDEEEYMASINFPELQGHKKLHEEIIEQLAKIIHTPANLNIIKTKMRVVAKRVLVEHILHEDTKIKLYQVKSEEIDENIIDLESF